MRPQTYLYRQGRHFHFRRRIPGLSTYIRPVRIALGTTDEKTAHTWSRTLITEFDAMLDAFLFVIDPLPEELIAQYFDARLKQTLNTLRRQSRMERMSGRSAALGAAAHIQRAVLETLLKDGINVGFPPHRLVATWSGEEAQGAVDLYAKEAMTLRSPQSRKTILADFQTLTGVSARSAEHEYQILEAYLHAKLAALGAEQDAQNIRAKIYEDRAKAIIAEQNTRQSIETPQMTAVPLPSAELHPVVAQVPLPNVPVSSVTGKGHDVAPTAAQKASAFTEGVDEITDPITIEHLRTQLQQAEKVARDSDQVGDGSDIASVFWRLAIADSFSKKTIEQRITGVRLFCLITGIQRVDQIKQHHLSAFRDAMTQFPKNFLRSQYDARKTYAEIRHGVRQEPGSHEPLSGSTRKRHTKTIELLLERAVSEGHLMDSGLDVSRIKPKLKGQAKKHRARSVFKLPEIQAVFGHTLWQGAKSKGRRHVPGSVITKDCRYWIPLILQYTGARRAEIAGLLASDIQVREGYDCIVIQANQYRGIKGEEPGETDEALKLTRVVPIHPHLIELGFLEYAQKMQKDGSALLFPDVVPSPRKNSERALAPDPAMLVEKFGESIDDMWRNSLKHTLNGNPRKLCMHSLRHYVNNFFLFSTEVSAAVRLDLLGHVDSEKQDTNIDVYRDDAPMELKAKAIRMLPRAF